MSAALTTLAPSPRGGQALGLSLVARPEIAGARRRVTLHLTMHLAAAGDLDRARLVGELRFVLAHACFDAPEEVLDALTSWLLLAPGSDAPRPAVERVLARLEDPGAAGHAPSVASRIRRGRDMIYVTEEKSFGFVDVVYENARSGLYRERILPRTVLPTHSHRLLDEAELVLGPGLLLQGRAAPPGLACAWPPGHPHRWENVTDIEQSFLCIDRPAFIPTDEIEIDVPVAALTLHAASRFFASTRDRFASGEEPI